ncbi:MAG: molybdopterin-dependent oxidoreductase [Candidatus Bathyarchaeia archaeon]
MAQQYTVKRFMCQNGVGGCIQQCALIGYVDANGKLVKVEGNPNSPINQGLICADRVPRIPDILYSEWQLKHPLKRTGARGENKWQRITWDQALTEIANKLLELKAKYGPETLALFEGTYRSDIYWARSRCLNLFGNPSNIGDPGTICFTHYVALHHAMLGDPLPSSDLYESNCIVNGGRDFNASFPLSSWFVQARLKRKDKPPLKLIVLDPRATDAVKDADIWMQPRPGTDAVIFLSWLNVIIQEKLYDREFVEKWTNAPLLVRATDKPRILRESDIKPGGSNEKFAVWNTATSSVAIWKPDAFEYEPKDAKPALEGSYGVQLADGSTAECKTVWQLIADRVKEYTPEEAERISWVPAPKIRESARMYATNRPGTINWTVPQDQSGWNAITNELVKCILRAVTGNLDVTGGEPLRGLGPRIKGKMAVRDSMLQMEEALPAALRRKQLGHRPGHPEPMV